MFFILLLSFSGLQWQYRQTSMDMEWVMLWCPDLPVYKRLSRIRIILMEGNMVVRNSVNICIVRGNNILIFQAMVRRRKFRKSWIGWKTISLVWVCFMTLILNIVGVRARRLVFLIIWSGFYPDWRWGYPYRAGYYPHHLFGLELRLVGRFFQTLCRTLSSLIFLVFRVRFRLVLSLSGAGHPWYRPFLDLFYRRDVNSEPQRNPPMRYYESIGENRNPEDIRFSAEYPRQSSADKNVLNKDPYDEENIEGNGSG